MISIRPVAVRLVRAASPAQGIGFGATASLAVALMLSGCNTVDEAAKEDMNRGPVQSCRYHCNQHADRCLDGYTASEVPMARQTGPMSPEIGPTADCADDLKECLTSCGSER